MQAAALSRPVARPVCRAATCPHAPDHRRRSNVLQLGAASSSQVLERIHAASESSTAHLDRCMGSLEASCAVQDQAATSVSRRSILIGISAAGAAVALTPPPATAKGAAMRHASSSTSNQHACMRGPWPGHSLLQAYFGGRGMHACMHACMHALHAGFKLCVVC